MIRDRDYEEQFLDHAAREVGLSGAPGEIYRERVWGRLSAGAEEYGEDSWAEKSFTTLVNEAHEETEDIGGWCLLASQLLNREPLSTDIAHMTRLHLFKAVSQAMLASQHLMLAASLYREYAGRPEPVSTPAPAISDS